MKAPEFDIDLRIMRQLARLATDKKITTVKRPGAAVNVLQKAPDDRRFHALVTSPGLDDKALAELVRDIILKGGPLVTLVAVVSDSNQAERAYRAGADTVLTFRDGSLVSPELVLRSLEARFPKPRTTQAVVPAEQPSANGSGVLVELWKFGQYFATPSPREPITIEVAYRVDEDLVEAAKRLVPKLSPSARVPDPWELDQILKSPGTRLILAREGETVVGLLTLHTFRATTGIHAWIQDLVVDDVAKGRGASEMLTREAVRLAKEQGAHTAEMASRPSQVGSARLYERLGFERRQTHLYRYRLTS